MDARTPRQVLGAAARLLNARVHGERFPSIAPSDGDVERVFIGPTNYAGQADRWARALETARPRTRGTSMKIRYGEDPFAHSVDQTVPSVYSRLSRRWQLRQLRALQRYRGVLLESARPFLGGLHASDVAHQLQELRDSGVSCALLFHGTDIRDPDAHAAREPHSSFSVDPELRARCRAAVDRSQELVARTGLPVYVSTLGLLREVPGAEWLPVVVEPGQWAGGPAPLEHGTAPHVVHAPSSLLKGTDLVAESLRHLHASGAIRYTEIRGVAHESMPEVYRKADIVLDQFRAGDYGVAAVEALAAGRVVIGHVSPEVRQLVSERTGMTLPILEATAETLEGVLQQIVADPRPARDLAAEGPEFARRVHDGALSGAVLRSWLDGVG